MNKLVFSLLMMWPCFCKGQGAETYILHIIDSLDRIQPKVFKKVNPQGCAYVITVKNQRQFDVINDEISKAIKAGKKNIQVKISRGVYQFHQEHIRRDNEKTEVSISFIGNNSVITSDMNYMMTGGEGSGWQEMWYSDSIIQVVDGNTKLCMIPYSNKLSEIEKKNLKKVQITQWFRTKTYNIERIDQKGIYFIANELTWENGYGHKGYNVNFDYLYLGKTPRFRLYDVSKEPNTIAARFITMQNCSYRSLTIQGIDFRSTNSSNVLLHLTNVDAKQIIINRCHFDYIRGNGVGYFSGTGNVVFDNNKVSNTGGDELFFSNNCSNIRITNNTFKYCGQSIGNTFCVRCYESTYYIANNTFVDFGYGAIGVGVWHGFTKEYPSQGIIEHNEIYFSPSYYANVWKHTLMDSGAIYTWTQNDEVIIRYNYIHDYTGAGDNRGLFCDDGACNLKIYKNIVLNTPNSYSIDARKVQDQHEGFNNNANNYIAYNLVDNGIRFEGYDGEKRHCIKGVNYIMMHKGQSQNKEMKYENLEVNIKDSTVNEQFVMDKFGRRKYK